MRRIKRYPLLRQEAFNDDAQDESEKSDIESPIREYGADDNFYVDNFAYFFSHWTYF